MRVEWVIRPAFACSSRRRWKQRSGRSPPPRRNGRLGRAIAQLVQAGDAEGVRKLLIEGHSPDVFIKGGGFERSLLFEACNKDYEAVVKVLLSRGASLKLDGSTDCVLNSVRARGSAELLVGSAKSSVEITRALIKARALVNEHSERMMKDATPLLAATLVGNVEVVAELIRAKADVNLTRTGGDIARVPRLSLLVQPSLFMALGATRRRCRGSSRAWPSASA